MAREGDVFLLAPEEMHSVFIRHERACTLLTGTDMTVHYFSRVFRSFEGVSPQEYRQSRRNNIIVDMK